jgi:hypothetical protein
MSGVRPRHSRSMPARSCAPFDLRGCKSAQAARHFGRERVGAGGEGSGVRLPDLPPSAAPGRGLWRRREAGADTTERSKALRTPHHTLNIIPRHSSTQQLQTTALGSIYSLHSFPTTVNGPENRAEPVTRPHRILQAAGDLALNSRRRLGVVGAGGGGGAEREAAQGHPVQALTRSPPERLCETTHGGESTRNDSDRGPAGRRAGGSAGWKRVAAFCARDRLQLQAWITRYWVGTGRDPADKNWVDAAGCSATPSRPQRAFSGDCRARVGERRSRCAVFPPIGICFSTTGRRADPQDRARRGEAALSPAPRRAKTRTGAGRSGMGRGVTITVT